MFGFFKKNKHKAPLSVPEVRDLLRVKNITPENVCSVHLKEVYARLKSFEGAPQFGWLDKIINENSEKPKLRNIPVLGVIIETREHPLLVSVVKNVIERTGVDVQIFHGTSNKEFIERSELKTLIDEGKIVLSSLEVKELSASAYNTLLLSKRFWRQLIARDKILMFQTDALLCKNSDYVLSDFLTFDYIGSKWKRVRPVNLILEGGNGGLSLRDWYLSYECLRRFSPEAWPAGEDGYFAFHLALMGAKVATEEDCEKFGTQRQFVRKSFGAHKITELSEEDRTRFLEYCEEARALLQN